VDQTIITPVVQQVLVQTLVVAPVVVRTDRFLQLVLAFIAA
jgi:hypothetical protein